MCQIVVIQRDCNRLHGGFQFVLGQVALPNDEHLPTVVDEDVVVLPVTFAIASNLCSPKVSVAFRHYKLGAAFVSVPETSVNKDCCTIFAHYDVRLTWDTLYVQSVPIPMCPQPPTNQHLRFGCLVAYVRHATMALGWSQDIGHTFIVPNSICQLSSGSRSSWLRRACT